MHALVQRKAETFNKRPSLHSGIRYLIQYLPLSETIENFWLESGNREGSIWREHHDINMVMLATSLAPDGYLKLNPDPDDS
jgi:hypothetical protein